MKIILKIIKGIFHVLSWIVYIFIGIYILCCIPILFGYTPLVVLSGSMEPVMPKGALIYYYHVDKDDVKKGDIITFEAGDFYVSHRVYDIIEEGKYQTRGDANNAPDANVVSFDKVKGKVHDKYIPYVGYYIQYINEHIYTIIVAVIILVSEFLLGTIDIEKIGKKGEKNNGEQQEE